MDEKNRTVTGTDIDEVKQLNSQSGLTYNEAKEVLANQKSVKSNTKKPR